MTPSAHAPDNGPLDGLRVLDFTRVLSGPHATRMLSDLGATVIKVEPPAGDTTRFANPRVNGLSGYFIQQNTGKQNISLDMGHPEALGLLLALADRVDVVIENFRPGVMERMGLGYSVVATRNPGVVYASISGYGQTGPWVHRRAYAPVVGAETGLTKKQGDGRGGQYLNDSFSHADLQTGMQCAAAILAALVKRERTGLGDYIDVSMGQSVLYVNEHVQDELWDGPDDPSWIRSFGQDEYPVLTAANGEIVVVSGHPAEKGNFESYMRAIERPDLLDDPNLADVASRKAHLAVIMDALHQWAASMPSADAIDDRISAAVLAVGTLRSTREVCETDWARERDAIVRVSDRGGGTVRIPNAPWRFARSRVGVSGAPRYRGEDNRRVLGTMLRLDESELDRLESEGVLSSRVPASAQPDAG